MVVVTLQRDKCIGCNYCYEFAPQRFRMSKKDGKSVLLESRDRKGFHTSHVNDEEFDSCEKAAKACPVTIIQVKHK